MLLELISIWFRCVLGVVCELWTERGLAKESYIPASQVLWFQKIILFFSYLSHVSLNKSREFSNIQFSRAVVLKQKPKYMMVTFR